MVPRAAPLADIRSRREVALHLEALAIRAGAGPIDEHIRLERKVSGSCRAPRRRIGCQKVVKNTYCVVKGAVEARYDQKQRGEKDEFAKRSSHERVDVRSRPGIVAERSKNERPVEDTPGRDSTASTRAVGECVVEYQMHPSQARIKVRAGEGSVISRFDNDNAGEARSASWRRTKVERYG